MASPSPSPSPEASPSPSVSPSAANIAFAYGVAVSNVQPEAVQELLIRMVSVYFALRDYGQKELGLELPITGEASASEWFRAKPSS